MHSPAHPISLSRPFALALLAGLLLLLPQALSAQSLRADLPFDASWHFHQGDLPADTSAAAGAGGDTSAAADNDATWELVSVPHSWSNAEAVPGKGFFSGVSWYSKRFAARPLRPGERAFLRFDAVSLVAEVFLNGKRLGEHRGGFAAFTYEITGDLAARNHLVVRVDNRRRPDTSPLGGDFTLYGGIYRPVTLFVTGPVDITPLDFASPGVFLKQTSVTPNSATVDVTTEVSSAARQRAAVAVRLRILDAANRQILTQTTPADVASGETRRILQTITLPHPHLWNGVTDPYLYHAQIDLLEHGKVVDATTQPLGLRAFHVDPERGFILNSNPPTQIHGVCLHQEFDSHGWAVTPAEEAGDLAIMREMGADGVRLVHYQHSQTFLDAADRAGLLVWAELTQIDHVNDTPEYHANIRRQLTELIRQNYNHPSIFVWSLYNELNSPTKALSTPLIKELVLLAHQEDPTRPTTGAASGDTISNLHEMVAATDLISDNNYAGWYGQRPEQIGAEIDKWNAAYDHRGLSISEYGSGAGIHQHKQGLVSGEVKPRGHFHPEEWQATAHEGNYREMARRPFVWGTFAWVMFDFASIGRHEGELDGINDKGLVTRDRQVRKDAYFFYQANWTTKPMVYITSRRNTLRGAPVTDIKVYSNQPAVTLEVNGRSLGDPLQPQAHVFIWKNVSLTQGPNRIHTSASSLASDDCTWTYTPGATLEPGNPTPTPTETRIP